MIGKIQAGMDGSMLGKGLLMDEDIDLTGGRTTPLKIISEDEVGGPDKFHFEIGANEVLELVLFVVRLR